MFILQDHTNILEKIKSQVSITVTLLMRHAETLESVANFFPSRWCQNSQIS